jgi:hypothetical protein
MPVIKPTCVRDLKQRVNLADVVGRVVTLRKAGGARGSRGCVRFTTRRPPRFMWIRTRGSTSASAAARRGTRSRLSATRNNSGSRRRSRRWANASTSSSNTRKAAADRARARSVRCARKFSTCTKSPRSTYHQAMFKAADDPRGRTFMRKYLVGAAPLRARSSRDEFKIGAVDAGIDDGLASDAPETPEVLRGGAPPAAGCFSSTTTPCSGSPRCKPAVPRAD